ncbi:MAG: FCD domain-containing protein [Gammaproteobacteria bacterium]|nr:FCD domain-containing protein [Gammaproteobacteria bacterium]
MRKKRLTTREIYQDLWQKIINFDLFPGSRVTEMELAEEYKTSRTPIREALKRLEVEGLITVRPKQGCYVRQVDIDLVSDYYTVRVALEAMTVELAIENMSDEELKAFADEWNPRNYKKHRSDPEYIKQFEERFHIVIAEGSRNPALLQYLEDVNNRIRPIRALGFPDDKSIKDTYEEHFEIITLIQNRDVARAREAMIAHIRKSQKVARSVTLSQLEQYRKKRPRRTKSA